MTRRRILLVAAVATAALAAITACQQQQDAPVVAKGHQPAITYACATGYTTRGDELAPVWGECATPECWRVHVRETTGVTLAQCVDPNTWAAARPGAPVTS